ncbi:uncharacterized protein KGF55_003680 [Candida pseudojiufengensis]|uniref:uncharacterized protein n=1 Tax=Candida pseudojiufengensis TaxID=497109 RepID=UPI00222558C5|nr:uncharacterized protein KGF55_003680 [Candida pseudojiufengensis]KAI5962604.1 hypothetical protein KGF55_003680 [Candida pseudojiufengensis]
MKSRHFTFHNVKNLRLNRFSINFSRQTSSSSSTPNISFLPFIRRLKPTFLNHFKIIDRFVKSIKSNSDTIVLERDKPSIIDKITNLNDKSTYSTNLQPIIKYLSPLVLSNYELAIISNGLTNLEVKLEINQTSSIYESEKIRLLGKNIYKYLLVNQLRIFKNSKYLSNSETEIEADLKWIWENSIIMKFMKVNGLSNCITINSEFLINEYVDQNVYNIKKQKVIDATTIGSFYTMIGLLALKSNHDMSNETINKILNGKRGIFDILKDDL